MKKLEQLQKPKKKNWCTLEILDETSKGSKLWGLRARIYRPRQKEVDENLQHTKLLWRNYNAQNAWKSVAQEQFWRITLETNIEVQLPTDVNVEENSKQKRT